MPDLIRHPVPRGPWFADQVRNDKTRVVIPELKESSSRAKRVVIPDSIRDPCLLTVPRGPWIADQDRNGNLKFRKDNPGPH